ncbi:MAG: peptide-methionine (S)-S-oxide reductase [Micavibrio sp.]|nr:peptide-methionine (S)-S-oxide reductase [Micavibrio sp.]|tara:strand:+ start:2053 stop:2562 length:510 start_codon:yes stop_codon:yes gene_type:complete
MTEKAIFAGGCFWGVDELFRRKEGVIATRVGYMGGTLDNPTYDDICKGDTGHAEAVEIEYDPKVISYRELLIFFFQIHDPTTFNRQGNDVGSQYRSAIFPVNEAQKKEAQKVMREIENAQIFEKELSTSIEENDTFYEAEKFHQKYLMKNPLGYNCHFVRKDLDFSKVA